MPGLVSLLVLGFTSPVAALEGPCGLKSDEECAAGRGGGFEISDSKSTAGRPHRVSGAVPVDRQLPRASITETLYVPTCSGNVPGAGEDVTCTAATDTCGEPGEVRLWVFTREVQLATGATSNWVMRADPPFVCVGPDDPVLDPTIAIAAIVQRDFQRVVVRKGGAQVSPTPDTLVNIPTRFSTDAPDSYDIPLTLLGQPVTITATARRWTWYFGDGTTASTTAAGTDGRVEHTYETAASVGAHVVIEWSGTYRVGGGAELPITGNATTVGDPTPLEVKQARSELVHDST